MIRLNKLSITLLMFFSLLLAGFGKGISHAVDFSMAKGLDANALEASASQPGDADAPMAVCTPDTSDMISYWPLNDGSGATVFEDAADDPNGYDNPGSCSGGGCPASVAGKINTAFSFNNDTVRLRLSRTAPATRCSSENTTTSMVLLGGWAAA
jgi:hypothetical protein